MRACLGSTYFEYNYTDVAGNAAEEVTREVEVINLAPEDLSVLDDRNLSILENEPNGTLVGVFKGSIQTRTIYLLTACLVWKNPIIHGNTMMHGG